MLTLDQACRSQPSYYWGERRDWIIAASVHRDSDVLERSNFVIITDRLNAVSDDDDDESPFIERFHHWAVGWIDYLLVDPLNSKQLAVVDKAKESLEQYPILDEEHFSALEQEEHDTYCVPYDLFSSDCRVCEGEKLDHEWHLRTGTVDLDCRLCVKETSLEEKDL